VGQGALVAQLALAQQQVDLLLGPLELRRQGAQQQQRRQVAGAGGEPLAQNLGGALGGPDGEQQQRPAYTQGGDPELVAAGLQAALGQRDEGRLVPLLEGAPVEHRQGDLVPGRGQQDAAVDLHQGLR